MEKVNIQEKMRELLQLYELANKDEKKRLLQIMKMYENTNEVYIPLYKCTSRFLVMVGGGGSGKSVFASQKIIIRYGKEKKRKCVVVRKVGETLRDSVFAELVNTIYKFGLENDWTIPKGRSSDLYLKNNKTGSEILFRGIDDIEKIKSIQGITDMWIEEATELDVTDINQLDIRMRQKTDTYEQMIITFNPISVTSYLKSLFFDGHIPNLQSGEIYNYLFSEVVDPKTKKKIAQMATVLHTTYKHNRFLSEAQIGTLERFKDTDPYYYMVYCLGEWGVLGKIVFDAQKVSNRIVLLRDMKIGEVGRMEYKNGEHIFVPDANGMWTVYKRPQPNFKFVLGADVAEGNKWGDYDASHILDSSTYEQCAVFHGHVDVDTYAEELIKGGYYYNSALICPEVNFNPGLVLNLERQNYPKLYLRQNSDSITHDIVLKHGFRTDKYNRQSIISDLVEYVRDHTDKINDIPTLEEMLTFVRNDKGKPEAQEGKHDDLVMAYAIALHAAISGQGGRYHKEEKKIKLKDLPPDCIADYYKANKEDRKILEKKWGLMK